MLEFRWKLSDYQWIVVSRVFAVSLQHFKTTIFNCGVGLPQRGYFHQTEWWLS